MTEHSEACTSSSVGKFGSAFSKLIIETLTEAVILVEDSIPGASLDGHPSQIHIVELKHWLKCTGANQSGHKGGLVKRLVLGTIASYSHIFIAKTYTSVCVSIESTLYEIRKYTQIHR